jgi:hypothetical protein
MMNTIFRGALKLLLMAMLCIQLTEAQQFEATGNTNPDQVGDVRVSFDLVPYTMHFALPAYNWLVTPNDIRSYNGWAETYDADVGGGSFEPPMDNNNAYSRMWIESENPARITVRWKAALCNADEIIANAEPPDVSPYGEGDWEDEWHYVYPDGYHVRKVLLYSKHAPVSKPFGWNRNPPNYVHEFQEIMVCPAPNQTPTQTAETEALTLIKMNGTHTNISYSPYPIHYGPSMNDLIASFGDFNNANIYTVNLKSTWHPFNIGRTDSSVTIHPYAPEQPEMDEHIFQYWGDPNGGWCMGLGHIVNWKHYQRTSTTLMQVYLAGATNSATP